MPRLSIRERLQRSYKKGFSDGWDSGLFEGYKTGYQHGYYDGSAGNDYDDTFFDSFQPNLTSPNTNKRPRETDSSDSGDSSDSNDSSNSSDSGDSSDSSDSSNSSDSSKSSNNTNKNSNKRPTFTRQTTSPEPPTKQPRLTTSANTWPPLMSPLLPRLVPPKEEESSPSIPTNNTTDTEWFDYDDFVKRTWALIEEADKAALSKPSPAPRPMIIINQELKSITDIINLGKTYSPECDYNINMKVLHDLVAPLEELNNLIGMTKVKEDIVGHLIYLLQKFDDGNQDMLHTVISGNPGVGKTTLGKILGQIYLKMGILENDKFIIAKRSDLIAKYLGQTAVQTQKVIDSAKGGVLFIDEAYSLGNAEGRDSFSKECLDTLNQNLSENRSFLCIIAGYTNELDKCFFSYNPGLKRRFSYRYNIDPYTPEQLREIFLSMVDKQKWAIASPSDVPVDFFKKHINEFKHFGGDMETLFLKCRIEHAKRVFCLDPDVKKKLTAQDIKNGFEMFKLHRGIKQDTDREELYRSIYT
jgi:hypothetical protein